MGLLPEEVPERPLDVFMAHLLPKVGISRKELELVQETVHRDLYDSERKQWPLDFTSFGALQADIVKKAEEILDKTATVNFLSDDNKVLKSDWDFHKARPVGVYLQNRAMATQFHWKNICRVDAYRVRGKDKNTDDVSIPNRSHLSSLSYLLFQDVGKVIWSMHYVLAQDIARRFTFGLTIEGSNVRLYFACRGFLVVSEEFNINEVSPLSRHASVNLWQ
jgi:hypothetical protein